MRRLSCEKHGQNPIQLNSVKGIDMAQSLFTSIALNGKRYHLMNIPGSAVGSNNFCINNFVNSRLASILDLEEFTFVNTFINEVKTLVQLNGNVWIGLGRSDGTVNPTASDFRHLNLEPDTSFVRTDGVLPWSNDQPNNNIAASNVEQSCVVILETGSLYDDRACIDLNIPLCEEFVPTEEPTNNPTKSPTIFPTQSPSVFPTKDPTKFPSLFPTTLEPTVKPTKLPTNSPIISPTTSPVTITPTVEDLSANEVEKFEFNQDIMILTIITSLWCFCLIVVCGIYYRKTRRMKRLNRLYKQRKLSATHYLPEMLTLRGTGQMNSLTSSNLLEQVPMSSNERQDNIMISSFL